MESKFEYKDFENLHRRYMYFPQKLITQILKAAPGIEVGGGGNFKAPQWFQGRTLVRAQGEKPPGALGDYKFFRAYNTFPMQSFLLLSVIFNEVKIIK